MSDPSSAVPKAVATTTVEHDDAALPAVEPTRIDALLERVDTRMDSSADAAAAASTALRIARIVKHDGRQATLRWRGSHAEFVARVADEIDGELLRLAVVNGESVLVETGPGAQPLVVGMVQTRSPRELVLSADKVRIEGKSEVTVVSGSTAVRLRSSGDLEMVASRISAASRGLFKLVGRMLRLN